MKTEGESVKRWYNYWPFLIAILLPIFNVETITIFLLGRGVRSYSVIAPICVSVGVLALTFWYKFSRWLWEETNTAKRLLDFINFNFQGRLGAKLAMSWIDKLNKDNKNNKEALSKIEVGGKIAGNFFAFVAALNPVPLLSFIGWFPCVVACGGLRWKKGLVIMMVGDSIKNLVMSYLWILLGPQLWHFLLLHLGGWIMVTVAVIAVIVIFTCSLTYRKLKKRPD